MFTGLMGGGLNMETLDNELMEKILKKWGVNVQLDILIEEASELIHAICKLKRRYPDRYYWLDGWRYICAHDVVDEIADVLIMIEQICYMMNLEPLVRKRMKYKIKRITKRLEDKEDG
jgi:NTP pyrophosphatase (non-canonical NTP hydrolase)